MNSKKIILDVDTLRLESARENKTDKLFYLLSAEMSIGYKDKYKMIMVIKTNSDENDWKELTFEKVINSLLEVHVMLNMTIVWKYEDIHIDDEFHPRLDCRYISFDGNDEYDIKEREIDFPIIDRIDFTEEFIKRWGLKEAGDIWLESSWEWQRFLKDHDYFW